MPRKTVAIVAALLILSPGVLAQTPSPPSRNVSRVAPQPIREAVKKEAVRLAAARRPASSAQAQSQRNWFARHPVLTGTLVGAGVGLAWIAAEGCGSSDYGCPGLAAFAAGTGAGLGALGGVVAAVILR